MGRPRANTPLLSIPVLLNEAQKTPTSNGQLRYANLMWETIEASVEDALHQLCVCIKWIVSRAERNMFQDRLTSFFGVFSSLAATKDRVECIEVMVNFLVEWSRAKDHGSRWKCCQLLAALINTMPEDADISDYVFDEVEAAMLARLEDGRPNVRAAAVRSLQRLPQPDDNGQFDECPVVRALLNMLQTDKSKEVRKAIIATLPVATSTIDYIVERSRDESEDVRKMTYGILAQKTSPNDIDSSVACLLLKRGLSDRSESVVAAARSMVTAWFDVCGGEPLALLTEINGAENTEAAELCLKALFASERLDAVHVARLAHENNLGLRADFKSEGRNLMSTEEALFWRVVCEHLSSEASSHGVAAATTGGAAATIEAASAGERLEAFDSLMPNSIEDLAAIIRIHMGSMSSCCELISLAASCGDFTDGSSRKAMKAIIEDILTSEAPAPMMIDKTFNLVRKVFPTEENLCRMALEVMEVLLESIGCLPLDSQRVHATNHSQLLRLLRIFSGFLASIKSLEDQSTGLMWGDLMDCLVMPCLSCPEPEVRLEAYKCQGLCAMLDSDVARVEYLIKSIFDALVSKEDDDAVRGVLIQGLGDIALQRGPKAIDTMMQSAMVVRPDDTGDPIPSVSDIMLHFIQEWIDAQEYEALVNSGMSALETLVRFASVNEFRAQADEIRGANTALEDGEMLRIIVKLFILCFDDCSDVSPKARQCLMVFFQRYATMSVTSQQYLATAMLPAARSAAAEDMAAKRKTIASGAIAPQVIKFASQLLQMPVLNKDGQKDEFGHEPLAELVMGEILECSRRKGVPKQYMAAMCKVPAVLPMYDAGPDTKETMMRIQVYAAHAAEILTDKSMIKDMNIVYHQYATNELPGLNEEEVEALLDGVRENVDAFCSGFPKPFENESDEDGSDFDEDAVPARMIGRRTLPSRVTRTTSNMMELSDDEDLVPDRTGNRIKEEENSGDDVPVGSDSDEDEDASEQENEELQTTPCRKSQRRASAESIAALQEALENKARIQ